MKLLISQLFVLLAFSFPALVYAVTPMVAAGAYHTVALKSDGTVVSWGWNNVGQLGIGFTGQRTDLTSIPGLTGVVSVKAAPGSIHVVALKTDGTVVSWGRNSGGQLGDGTTQDRYSPVAVLGLTGVVAVSSGSSRTLALKSDGTVVTWGYINSAVISSPVPVSGLSGVVATAAGVVHTVALKSDGTVVAWGGNFLGQLGDGTTTDRLNPVTVPGLSGVVAVSAGAYHTVALKSDGTVVAWGSNGNGQLGDGTVTDRWSPVVVPGLTGVVGVSTGTSFTVALKSDGTVMTWGSNGNGQLGDGTTTQRNSPVTVLGLTGVVSVDAGDSHTLGIKTDGAVMAWGSNSSGQLGDGTTQDRYSPVLVFGLTLGTTTPTAISINPTALTFSAQSVGSSGAPQTLTLTNTGSDAASLSSFILSGDYARTTTCRNTLAAGATCTISVTFTPIATGARSGSMVSSASNQNSVSVTSVSLNGTGVIPIATPGTSSLNFGTQNIGTTSDSQAISLTNSGGATLAIRSIVASGDYTQSNTCGPNVAAGASCSISVAFVPTAVGTRSGTVTITSNAAPSTVSVVGTGRTPVSNARLFAFAEASIPSLFSGASIAGQLQQYSYRYYPISGNYLAVDTSGMIFVLGPYSGNALLAVGTVESFRTAIVDWETAVAKAAADAAAAKAAADAVAAKAAADAAAAKAAADAAAANAAAEAAVAKAAADAAAAKAAADAAAALAAMNVSGTWYGSYGGVAFTYVVTQTGNSIAMTRISPPNPPGVTYSGLKNGASAAVTTYVYGSPMATSILTLTSSTTATDVLTSCSSIRVGNLIYYCTEPAGAVLTLTRQ